MAEAIGRKAAELPGVKEPSLADSANDNQMGKLR